MVFFRFHCSRRGNDFVLPRCSLFFGEVGFCSLVRDGWGLIACEITIQSVMGICEVYRGGSFYFLVSLASVFVMSSFGHAHHWELENVVYTASVVFETSARGVFQTMPAEFHYFLPLTVDTKSSPAKSHCSSKFYGQHPTKAPRATSHFEFPQARAKQKQRRRGTSYKLAQKAERARRKNKGSC